jgi:flavorubredoxin
MATSTTHGDHEMEAIVVYESVWGNTAAIARAIAEGLGEGTGAYATDEVPAERLANARLSPNEVQHEREVASRSPSLPR